MTKKRPSLALLKTPTGWLTLALLAGFIYLQWPTRVPTTETPSYHIQQLPNKLNILWEEPPQDVSTDKLRAWGLKRDGISFLLQIGTLTEPFLKWVEMQSQQDQQAVNGAIEQPLKYGEDWASIAFFDVESRVQQHLWLKQNEIWIKASVLYKPSRSQHTERAQKFLNSLKHTTIDASLDNTH